MMKNDQNVATSKNVMHYVLVNKFRSRNGRYFVRKLLTWIIK